MAITTRSGKGSPLTHEELDTNFNKLDGIETAATADQTGAEIKTLYEAEANAYTDTKDTKLTDIEELADVTDATNVDDAGAVMESDATTASMSFVVDEDTMTSNLATKVPTQQSVKAYVDSQVQSKDALSELSGDLDDITDGTTYVKSTNDFTDTEQTKVSNLSGTNTGDQTITLTGDVTGTGTGSFATTIATDAVDIAMLSATGTAGATTFLRGDNSWVTPTDTGDTTYTAGTGITLDGTEFSASPIALTTVQTAANETAHLALTAEEGDIVVRSDENKTYCHNGGSAGTMADYTLLATPTDAVTSVNGNTGVVTGLLETAGGTMTGDIAFGDDDKAKFGANNELQIHTLSGVSYIEESGTGNLNIDASNLSLRNSSNVEFLKCNGTGANGDVYIKHNGSTVLNTTSTGVDITGSVTADGLTLDTTSDNPSIVFKESGAANFFLGESSAVGGGSGFYDLYAAAGLGLRFYTAAAERMRIDSSGNVLVGTTDTNVANNSGSGNDGVNIHPDSIRIARTDGDMLLLNRLNSDGDIVKFFKDGTTVGSIGTEGGNLTIDGNPATGKSGIGFSGAEWIPRDNSSNTDGAISLGASANRFKDLYLSGTANVGAVTSSGDITIGSGGSTPDLIFNEGNSSIIGPLNANFLIISRGNGTSEGISLHGADGAGIEINKAGNVGIGVTPESWHSEWNALQIGDSVALSARTNSDTLMLTNNAYFDSVSGRWEYIGANGSSEATYYVQNPEGKHVFYVAPSGTADSAISWTEAMTIDNSGNVLVGTSSLVNSNSAMAVHTAGGGISLETKPTSDGYYPAIFYNASSSAVGYIWTDVNSTSYSTSSDYRLKENVVPMTGSIDRLKALKPSRFNFIADADTTVDGFLAHEAQEVVPEAITGEKDAMQTEEYTVSEALGEVFTPAVEAIEEVTETNITTPAVEAQDAVMGERQVMETIETGSYVNLAGETITETQEVGVTEEATETVVERQTGEDGITREVEVERTVNVPVMETYEVSPAIEAVDEVTETIVITEGVSAVAEVILETDVENPEELTEGQWRETTAKVTAEREVPDMQGIDQAKLVPLLVSALQEAVARIEQLENA